MRKRRAWWSEERFLIVAGVFGIGAATFLACDSDSNDNDTSETAGAGGSAGSESGAAGKSAANGGSGGSSSSGTQVSCASSSSTGDNTAAVADAAKAFLDALTADQQSAAKYDKTLANAQQWSNFPTTFVQLDGPRVWIEVTIQGGIVYHDRVHYHTIWRDKVADYGAEYAGS